MYELMRIDVALIPLSIRRRPAQLNDEQLALLQETLTALVSLFREKLPFVPDAKYVVKFSTPIDGQAAEVAINAGIDAQNGVT